jgi:DNA modification methylase
MTVNTIFHQDSRTAGDVLRQLGSVNAIITDPPYGVDYRSRHATTPTGLKYVKDVSNDRDLANAISLFDEVMDVWLPYATALSELYVFTRWDIVGEWIEVVRGLSRHGFKYKMLLVWDKGEPGTGDIDNNWGCGHELIIYAKKGLRRAPFRRSGVLHFDKVAPSKIIHPTEKPVSMLEELVKFSTDKGEIVGDPFSGSGAVSVACRNTGRNSIAFETDEAHYHDSLRRLETTTLF